MDGTRATSARAVLVVVLGVAAAILWLRVGFDVGVDRPVLAEPLPPNAASIPALPSGDVTVGCPGPLAGGEPSSLRLGGEPLFLPLGAEWVLPDTAAACAEAEADRWAGAAALVGVAVLAAVALEVGRRARRDATAGVAAPAG